MAEVRLDVEKVLPGGIVATYTGSLSLANTYLVRNSGKVFLHFKKTALVDCTVTVQTPVKMGGLDVDERTFSVPATTGDKFAGPFPPSIYNDGLHDLKFTLSDVDGVSVAVLEI